MSEQKHWLLVGKMLGHLGGPAAPVSFGRRLELRSREISEDCFALAPRTQFPGPQCLCVYPGLDSFVL